MCRFLCNVQSCSVTGCSIKGRLVVMTTRQRLNIVSLKRLDYWQKRDTSEHHWITEWKRENSVFVKYFTGVF